MEYVGEKSGASYAAGLKWIEACFNVELDEEFNKDKCESLLNQLSNKIKNFPDDTKGKKLIDCRSYLKKYIMFMAGAEE